MLTAAATWYFGNNIEPVRLTRSLDQRYHNYLGHMLRVQGHIGLLVHLITDRTLFMIREETMIKVSVLYPNIEGKKFDMEYYLSKHIPMVQQKLGDACKGVAVEAGLGGAEPGSAATYIAMGHLYFDSVAAFQSAFGPHAQAIMGDIPNYSEVQPAIQLSEVKI